MNVHVDMGNRMCVKCIMYSHLVSLNMVACESNSPFVRALLTTSFFSFFPHRVDVTKKIASDIHKK